MKINQRKGMNMINITDVRIRLVQRTDSKLKAIASVTFNDCFVVHDIKIFEQENNHYIAMPSRKTIEGEYKDIAHPLNTETRISLQEKVLEYYYKTIQAQ